MPESVHNDEEVRVEEILDHGQELSDQTFHHVPPNFGQMPSILSELAHNSGDPNY